MKQPHNRIAPRRLDDLFTNLKASLQSCVGWCLPRRLQVGQPDSPTRAAASAMQKRRRIAADAADPVRSMRIQLFVHSRCHYKGTRLFFSDEGFFTSKPQYFDSSFPFFVRANIVQAGSWAMLLVPCITARHAPCASAISGRLEAKRDPGHEDQCDAVSRARSIEQRTTSSAHACGCTSTANYDIFVTRNRNPRVLLYYLIPDPRLL